MVRSDMDAAVVAWIATCVTTDDIASDTVITA